MPKYREPEPEPTPATPEEKSEEEEKEGEEEEGEEEEGEEEEGEEEEGEEEDNAPNYDGQFGKKLMKFIFCLDIAWKNFFIGVVDPKWSRVWNGDLNRFEIHYLH